jgi:hypothetical protein
LDGWGRDRRAEGRAEALRDLCERRSIAGLKEPAQVDRLLQIGEQANGKDDEGYPAKP